MPSRGADDQAIRILLATDFSPDAGAAVDWAKRLSSALNARVTVLHVLEQREMVPTPRKETQEKLDQLAGEFEHGQTRLVEGSPGEKIVEIGNEEADLIIMGTHGRKGIARMLMGSVAEHVLRSSHPAVLTVRMPEKGG